MKKLNRFKLTTLSLTAVMLAGLGQSTFAHTRLDVPTQTEGTRIINHMVIGHSCNENTRTIGTSVVFPDGVDSTILVDGQPHNGQLLDFLTNYGNNAQLLLNHSAFTAMDEKIVNGNVVGFWAGGGSGMPNNLNVATPFRLTAASINPTSCAKSVAIKISVADICEITGVNDFREGTVELWTHNDLGTPFDRVSATDDGPATLTIARNLATNPLPSACGEGVAVVVKPSAAQINRDMPIRVNGEQFWPK
ncbi:MAG: hypothetical protein Q8K59_04110 [Nitrosomonas sp.]|nr:hypothetical protein [Nitrosomonas sp.]MDP1950273.1 hypothetical protein [Nitrosomonas sp.]